MSNFRKLYDEKIVPELMKEHNFLKEYDVDVTDDIEEIKEFNEKDEENVR